MWFKFTPTKRRLSTSHLSILESVLKPSLPSQGPGSALEEKGEKKSVGKNNKKNFVLFIVLFAIGCTKQKNLII